MKPSSKILGLALFSLLFAAGKLTAQTTLLGWDFFGQSSPASFNATTKNGNLDSTGTLSRGAGAAASSASNSFRTSGFQNNGISTANTDYFQFAISATSGYTLSLNSITANFAGTSTFAASPGVSMQYAYSTDGTTFTLIGSASTVVGTPGTATVSLSGISALQSLAASTDITFRFYASGQTTTGGWGFNSAASGTNGLAITGTLTALASPSLTWSGANGGTWDTSSLNFTSGAAAWSNTTNATDKAIFPSASQSLTVAAGITAGALQFDAAGIALSGGSLINGNATAALTAIVTNSTDTATVSTSINDGGKGLAKDGAGILVLAGSQADVTGTITVTNGTLQTDAGVISGKNIVNNGTLELTSGTHSSGTITNNATLLKSGTGTATINTAVSGTGATTITGGTLAIGVNQAIGTGNLTLSGGGTLDLGSHDAAVSGVSLTGSSIVNAGVLTLGASATLTTLASPTTSTIGGATLALGNTSHSFSIADGSAASDLTISAGLTGTSAGTLTKSGNGTLTLSGNNSLYAGNVTLGTNSGLLVVDHANALGTGVTKFNGGTLTGNGTTLSLLGNTYQLQGSGGTIGGSSDLTLNGNWTDTGATNLNLSITNTGNTTLAGNFTISAAKTISTIVGTNLTMTGILSGAGSGLTKSGTGTLTLSGANTYTGNTTITNGTLKLGASNVIADTVNVIINAIAGATATFDLDGNSDTFASLTFGGTSGTATSTSNLSTGAGTLTLGGNLTYDATNHPLGSTLSGKLDLGASRTFAIGDSTNAATDLAISANISGTGFSLTKTGAGTLALSGTNTYSGGTTVSAGVIAANSSTALGTGVTTIDNTGTVAIPTAVKINSNFTVNSGGTLTGTGTAALGGIVNGPGGTLAGTLTFASGSSLAPGSSPGLLNITGAVTFASGSRYTWELGAFSTATPGTNFDQVVIANSGSLSLLAGATLMPTFTGTATSPTAGNGFWTSAQTWTVVTNSGGTGTVTGTAFSIDNSAWSGSGNFATALSNNEVLLTWTPSAIPEPSTYAAIMGAIALGATIWQRRHRSRR